MRGRFRDQGKLFSYVSPESRVPAEHPLQRVRQPVRDVLTELSPSLGRLYARDGRPSIPPEQLLSALLLQVFYGIRSERLLMEQLDYDLLYRWFVGLSPDDPAWDATTFTKNRERCRRRTCAFQATTDWLRQGFQPVTDDLSDPSRKAICPGRLESRARRRSAPATNGSPPGPGWCVPARPHGAGQAAARAGDEPDPHQGSRGRRSRAGGNPQRPVRVHLSTKA
jgi:hypothetical protein